MAFLKIRFVNSNGFVSRAITYLTESLFDHVEIETEDGSWLGAHAESGVQLRDSNYLNPTREYRYSIPCTDLQFARSMEFANDNVGTHYNYEDIAGLVFKDRRLNDPHAVICSQFVTQVAAAGGIWMLNVLPGYEYLVTPETLHLSPLLIGHCTYKKG